MWSIQQMSSKSIIGLVYVKHGDEKWIPMICSIESACRIFAQELIEDKVPV